MLIELIRARYKDNMVLQEANNSEMTGIPDVLKSILAESDGIKDSMIIPKTGERISVGWIIFPYDMILRQTTYYRNEYGIEGIVFSDDGAGNPYYIHEDKVFQFDPIDNESELKADSLEEFFRKGICTD